MGGGERRRKEEEGGGRRREEEEGGGRRREEAEGGGRRREEYGRMEEREGRDSLLTLIIVRVCEMGG